MLWPYIQVYQEVDNFDDNGFAWFDNYRKAKPGSPLFDKACVCAL